MHSIMMPRIRVYRKTPVWLILLGTLCFLVGTNVWIKVFSSPIIPDANSSQWEGVPLIVVSDDKDSTQTKDSSRTSFVDREELLLLRSGEPPLSNVHCLAETFNETRINTPAALYRSCRYENMCYHVNKKRLVLFPSTQHWRLLSTLHSNIHLSSVSKPVFVSAVNQHSPTQTSVVTPQYLHHTNNGDNNNTSSIYYMMKDTRVVWIPIQPESCQSVLWDIYLPVYTLLELFDLQAEPFRLLLLDREESNNNNNYCTRKQLEEYADAMELSMNDTIVSTHGDLSLHTNTKQDKFVCYQRSVMGMGAHADHQVDRSNKKQEHQYQEDKILKNTPPNHIRRETNLRGFRNFLLQKMKVTPQRRTNPCIVAYSSSIASTAAEEWIPSISGIEFMEFSPDSSTLRQQMQVTTKATILILASNQEDKTAAFFLPEGATLILVGEAQEDWDLWSNNALLRVHLLVNDIKEAMEYLIRDELSRLLEQHEDEPSSNTTTMEQYRVDNFAESNRSVTLVHASPPTTRVHCVGEKMFPNILGATQYRSCHFENLCFDLESKSFVMFPSPLSLQLMQSNSSVLSSGNYFSSIPRTLVASPQVNQLGGGFFADIPRVIHNRVNVSSYYRLDGAWLASKTFNTANFGKYCYICIYIHLLLLLCGCAN